MTLSPESRRGPWGQRLWGALGRVARPWASLETSSPWACPGNWGQSSISFWKGHLRGQLVFSSAWLTAGGLPTLSVAPAVNLDDQDTARGRAGATLDQSLHSFVCSLAHHCLQACFALSLVCDE